MTRLGLSVGLPAFSMRARQRHLSAMPASIAASLEPVVEQPVAVTCSGAFHRSARMLTQRDSISAVCGYSSLSIMFLSAVSAIRSSAGLGIQVVTNVARLSRACPSSSSSELITSYAESLPSPLSGRWSIGSSASPPCVAGSLSGWLCLRSCARELSAIVASLFRT